MGCCCGASAIDPNEALNQVRAEAPEVLIENEEFHFAFAFTRDQVYFTNVRILVKDKQGLFGGSVEWRTIPYTGIKAFYVETAGTLDLDVEMGFWPSGISNGEFDRYNFMPGQAIEISFKKGGGVDLFALQRMLNQKIFNPSGPPVEVAPQPEGMQDENKFSNFVDLLGGDARAIDPKTIENQLKVDPPVLMPDEKVDMAFKCGRDTTCLTNRRILRIDVKGLTGKKINYKSYLWSCIRAFAVETAGMFIDRDCELTVWNNIQHIDENKFSMDLRASSTDPMAVQRYLADMILGQDLEPPSVHAATNAGQEDRGGGWKAWLAGDMRMIDVAEANRKFHEEIQILQGSEACEMAFKAARDMILFTTKRMLLIDPQGLTGQKVEYKSIPWKCVQAFALQSPGAFLDKDSEMMVWTDIFYSYFTEEEEIPGGGDGEETQTRTVYIPEPGQSFFSVDFDKHKVDLGAIGRYLASRCALLGSQSSMPPTPVPEGLTTPASEPGLIEKFISWLGDDYRVCDPDELDAQLHGDCSMLLPEERVQMGFVCGRDTVILTTHRAMKIDKQGFTGAKVLYLSLPWTKIKGYMVESAGTFDLDAKMNLTIKAPWYNRSVGTGLDIDFARGRCDITAVNKYISAQVIGAADGSSAVPREILPEQPEGLVSQFLSWIGDDYKQISAAEATEMLTSNPAMLLGDEAVDIAFKCGRDMIVLTTKRFMKIDTQGWTGQKVSYTSVPYASVPCFGVTGAAEHPFDRDAEIRLNSDAAEVKFDVKKDQGDIMAVYTLLNRKVLLDKLNK